AAFHAWARAEGRPMAAILAERGDLDADQRAAVEALAVQRLKKYGDAGRSLAALDVGGSTRDRLARLGDPALDASLARVGTAPVPPPDADGAAERTAPYDVGANDRPATYTVGTATSAGQRFRVLRPHAKGGLGAVFVALDAELHREVALKQILDRHADDPI